MSERFVIALDASAAPREFRILRAGVNESTQGPFVFDAAAAELVMAAAGRWGNRYPIDYSHGQVRPATGDPAEQRKSAGSFLLALRGGELWAVDVRWTNEGRERVEAKEFPYFSPAFDVEKVSGGVLRVVEFTNLALTALPSMFHLEPLVTLSKEPITMAKPTTEALRARAHAAHDTMHGGPRSAAMKTALDEAMDGMDHAGLRGYTERLERMAKYAGTDAPEGEPDGDETEPPAQMARPHKEPDGDEPAAVMEKKMADEKKPEALAKDAAPTATVTNIVGPGAGELRLILDRLAVVEKENEALKASVATDKRAVVLERAVRDGKVTPSEAKGEGARGKFLASLSLDSLEAYVASHEPKVRTERDGATQPGDAATAGDGRTFSVELSAGVKQTVTLSAADLDLAEKFGNDPAHVAKQRALEMQRAARSN